MDTLAIGTMQLDLESVESVSAFFTHLSIHSESMDLF